MAGLINLPGYNPGNALSFQGLNAGIDSAHQQQQQQVQNHLAQSQLGMQREQLGMQREKHGVTMQNARTEQEMNEARMAAGRVQGIMGLPPEQQPAAWQATRKMPGFSSLGPEFDDFNYASKAILAKAHEYIGEGARADIDLKKAQAQKALREAANGGETPANIREWQAFQRMSQEQQQQYLTMKRAQQYRDTGTAFVLPNAMNPTAAPVASIPKDVAGKASQQAQGTEQGKALIDLPKVKQGASTTLRYIDEVLNDRNLGNVTGIQGYMPTVLSASRDTERRIDQLGGRAFLSAFESLKGAGQITEIEGQKATEALARLKDLKQSDGGYKQALQDFRGEVMNIVRIAEQRARGAGPYVPPAGTPTDAVQRPNTDRLGGGPPQRLRFNPETMEIE